MVEYRNVTGVQQIYTYTQHRTHTFWTQLTTIYRYMDSEMDIIIKLTIKTTFKSITKIMVVKNEEK